MSDLDALLALQDLDTARDQVRHRGAHLPERAELAAIDRQAAELDTTIGAVTATRDEIAARQAAIEAELAATEERAAAVNRRLYGGEVSASRELQALAADVDTLKARASGLEDQVLELMEQREPLDAGLVDAAAQREALDERRRTLTGALAAAAATVDDELARLDRLREESAAAVPADALAAYERLRARLDGVAVARLVGSHCDGCHLTLPSMELDRIRHLPPDEVVTCEQCGRILVRVASGKGGEPEVGP
ncbi:MAG TPA: C4-type zinc ribbon domain-containing protein [Acidimicrobiales bacterium]